MQRQVSYHYSRNQNWLQTTKQISLKIYCMLWNIVICTVNATDFLMKHGPLKAIYVSCFYCLLQSYSSEQQMSLKAQTVASSDALQIFY